MSKRDLTSLSSRAVDYPAPPDKAAYYGLAGEIVRRIAPQTEADPVALLVQFLVAFGNVIDRMAHSIADGSWHYLNLFCVLVGDTSKGRKGTACNTCCDSLPHADEGWKKNCLASGLSSGEGVIHAVRDQIKETKPVKDKGKYTGKASMWSTDSGVMDKRLMVIEGEFCSALRSCRAKATRFRQRFARHGTTGICGPHQEQSRRARPMRTFPLSLTLPARKRARVD